MQGKTGDSLQVIFVLINTYIPFSDLNFGTSTGIFLCVGASSYRLCLGFQCWAVWGQCLFTKTRIVKDCLIMKFQNSGYPKFISQNFL